MSVSPALFLRLVLSTVSSVKCVCKSSVVGVTQGHAESIAWLPLSLYFIKIRGVRKYGAFS